MGMIVNGKVVNVFPHCLDKEKKVCVEEPYPLKVSDREVGLRIEAYHGIARITQTPDENVVVMVSASEDGVTISVDGVVEEGGIIYIQRIHTETENFRK